MVSIKALRITKLLTQEDMAKLLGISVNAYSAKELGKVDWKLKEFIKVCDILGCSINDVIETKS